MSVQIKNKTTGNWEKAALGAKEVQDQIGDLTNLNTTAKTNLVAAINEAAQSGGGGSDDGGSTTTPIMQGATAYADGVAGSAPQPLIADRNKALFGNGQYMPIYSSTDGSTVMITTTITELYGQTVTLTDGYTTRTGTIGNDGKLALTDVLMFGTVTATATDTNSNLAVGQATLTYFGYYMIVLTEDFATVNVTTTDTALFGQTFDVIYNGDVISTATFNASGAVTLYLEEIGIYKFKAQVNGKIMYSKLSVLALQSTYSVTAQAAEVYGFYIDKTNSNPSTCVHPYTDCEYGCLNANFTPLHTNQDSTSADYGKAIYGSWTGNEFFFPKPCMLRYNGTRDYYLDPNDYSKKIDGVTASDYDDMNYGGNVMVEFPTIYFQRTNIGDCDYCVVSDRKLDNTFHAYAHHDINGNVLPYIYLAAYNSSFDGTRLRSISGISPHNANTLTNGKLASNTTAQQEIVYAAANNSSTGAEGWTIEHIADRDMVNDLLVLVTMRTDTDVSIGRGKDSGYSSTSNTGQLSSGTMNNKGLFYGITSDGDHGCKVFGIENWWGNYWRRLLGWILSGGTQYRKMTFGTEDGSTVDGFNLTGNGYVQISDARPSGTSGGYINVWKYSDTGLVPITASGSSATYLCDGLWYNNSSSRVALAGGSSFDGLPCGAFCSDLSNAASVSYWGIAAALSYKSAG